MNEKRQQITPRQCRSMAEVREEIDRLDQALVPLLLERLAYIEQAGCLKKERQAVRDEERIDDVLQKTSHAAQAYGGNTVYIEDIYHFLMEWSIRHEFDVWDDYHPKLL